MNYIHAIILCISYEKWKQNDAKVQTSHKNFYSHSGIFKGATE
jgi:hypothetical protein